MHDLLEKRQTENTVLKQKLEEAEQLRRFSIKSQKNSSEAYKEANSVERPLDIINITLMRDQAKNLYKAVEKLPIDIKQIE